MKTLLVLAEHPDFAEAIRAGINSEQYRVVHRTSLEEAEPLLVHGLAEACIMDVELAHVQGIWSFEKLRRRAPKCPIIVYASGQWEWEEEAYLQGANHVLSKPVRPRMLSVCSTGFGLSRRRCVPPRIWRLPWALNRPDLPTEARPLQAPKPWVSCVIFQAFSLIR